MTEPRPNGRRDEAVAALANDTAALPDEAGFGLDLVAHPHPINHPESTPTMTSDKITPAPADPDPPAGPEATTGPPAGPPALAWSGASPAPAGIPQRPILVRTQPELTATAMPRRPVRRPPDGRRPAIGLPLLVLLGVLALFVAWVSAEPFWLAVGHQDTGTIEVTRCTGHGPLGTRCIGSFTTPRGYAVDAVTVSGAPAADRVVGKTLPARMVSKNGRIAYTGDTNGLHLRWLLGLGLLLLVGLGMASAMGAWQFRGTARLGAVLTSLAAPILIGAVALAVMY